MLILLLFCVQNIGTMIAILLSITKRGTVPQKLKRRLRKMNASEIKKALDDAGMSYIQHGEGYFQVQGGIELEQSDFPEDQTCSIHEGLFLVSATPFDGEDDIASTLEYCGLYSGQ
jgi:hypothetical protein